MVRRLGLATGIAVIPFAALLAAACSGSDFLDASEPSTNGGDGALLDGRGSDATLPDSDTGSPDLDGAASDGDGADADAALSDAEGGFDSGTGPLMQSLGTASSFVVLAASAITNSGIGTALIGDIGTPGTSITGLAGPPLQPSGKTELGNARATQALLDVGTAYTALANRACPPANDMTGQDLGGRTLAPGVYCFSTSAGQLSASTLTFDAKGDPNAVWVIQVATALTIEDNATAIIIGGPPSLACRVFWTTGTAATINGSSHFLGNVLASSATSLLTNATLDPGRAFGITGGVTLLNNTVSAALCP